ncbi:hypothetical protein B0A52_09880 [Exophiala mesophila]|uniref:Pyridoxamine 5'-phosphate oxidase putative domain-containing protein n=1 Tax=Exophiala mesophila TaxID=212818 RepID=A0A438MSD1_EXOME|nr:hypothetical protein B0A52_09880 [Exophiala mesophila]
MGAFFETLPPSLVDWLLAQRVLYVASAPLSGDGCVNVSPKGITDKGGPFFGVLREPKKNPDDKDVIKKFWYVDLSGSGIETTSHLHEPGNGRITVMFNAFEGPPRILRIYGKGTPLEYGTKEFNDLVKSENLKLINGTRSIIMVDIHQVGTSCGFSVPTYEWTGYRTTLHDFFDKKVACEEEGNRKEGIEVYWAFKNAWSMDGLPGLKRGVQTGITDSVKPIKKMVGKYAPIGGPRMPRKVYTANQLILVSMLSSLLSVLMVLVALMVYGTDTLETTKVWIKSRS